MTQDDGLSGNDSEGTEELEPRKRSTIWPWILLALVVLVVALLLWVFWRQPKTASVTVIEKTTEIPLSLPEQRPEPVVPLVESASTETSNVALVPDVIGDPRSSAVRTLESTGHAVSTSEVRSASRASGLVVGQSPAGGTPLDRGGVVAISLSVGTPALRDVSMPEVVGLSQAAAESRVKAAGVVPYLTYGDVGIKNGYVISQWPLAGEAVPEGSGGFIQVQLRP
jgi:serine/threonine-protein kinase